MADAAEIRCGARASGDDVAASLARGLGLAAAPVFALMALWTQFQVEPGSLCSATSGATSPMALMYLMMGAAHLAPWIRHAGRLLSGEQAGSR